MLPAELAQTVKRIQFVTGRQVADVMAGAYLSVFRGRGMEFDEVRPYVPGDDVRTIDWNVTARTGEPHVKRFVEERELTVMLLVDISGSQDFGSGRRSKLEAAAELSALLAMSAIANDDKVGLLLFERGADHYIPPRKGQNHALRVVREVLSRGQATAPRVRAEERASWPKRVGRWWQALTSRRAAPDAGRQTSITAALEFCRQVLPRKTVLFLISDFLDDGYWQTLRHTNRRHDVVAVVIGDARERQVPDTGLVTLEDAESGERRLVDTGAKEFREAWAEAATARAANLRTQLGASGIDLIEVDATESIVDPVLRFFRARERRIRR